MAAADRFVYGLTQPLLGIRLLATHRELLIAAVIPAVVLAAVCAVIAVASRGRFVHEFYTTFAVLAPLPSIVFAAHYARMAVTARHAMGFAPAAPCIEPLGRLLRRTLQQAILVAIAIAPVSWALHMVPGVGGLLGKLFAAAWALHWVVVEAFDSARVMRPGQTLADLDAEAQQVQPPWYVRGLHHAADHAPLGGGLLRRFARLCDRLSVSWREEIALVEHQLVMVVGFALSTAALLAIPVLDLAFRPIILIAAVHVLGQLEPPAPRDQSSLSSAGRSTMPCL
ncbi:MAG TPA: hypothetical protein VFP84_34440 [Kofleriaceae bacterium]|nr:hypothetical protein [Kofleriaceae bacterium]